MGLCDVAAVMSYWCPCYPAFLLKGVSDLNYNKALWQERILVIRFALIEGFEFIVLPPDRDRP